MLKKKIEVTELNKKENQITLEEKKSPIAIFFKKNNFLILLTLIIFSLTTVIAGFFIGIKNIYKSETPNIKVSTIDTTLTKDTSLINSTLYLDEIDAKNSFLNSKIFKSNGEVLLTKTVEAEEYLIRYYSDGTAIKIIKSTNKITRINALEDGSYGISKDGTITTASILDVNIDNVKDYSWGTVTYFSDGSAEISNAKINMFVRNSSDINENYIANHKVSYLKETKKVGNDTLNYYYDGTILIIKNNKNYIIRNNNDLSIKNQSITFPSNNESTIINTLELSDNKIIDYYTDGSAIIKDGSYSISVRKSNSIIIKNNKIFEIVDNIYVTESLKKDNIIYYTNGSATYTDGKTIKYIEENSNIKYQDGKISKIEGNTETLTNKLNDTESEIKLFEKTAIITKKDNTIMIVDKDIVTVDPTGKIEYSETSIDDNISKFNITNNSNNKLKYRIILNESQTTTANSKYIKYQMLAKNKYIEPTNLNTKIWNPDELSKQLNLNGKNYILLDDEIEAYDTVEIKLMIWSDYQTIPNSEQNKYFYGTIRIYAWEEL